MFLLVVWLNRNSDDIILLMKFSKIFDFFPPPKFLNLPFVGVSISDSAVRCIQFGKKDGGLHIEKYTERKINPGVVIAGNINNKEELKHILTELKKDLKLEYVRVSLPEEKAYLFTAKIPIVKNSEIKGVVESKIEENVPIPGAELIFDYRVIDHRKRNHLDLVVSSFPISFIDLYLEIMRDSGLSLLSLEIESQAIARAVLPQGDLGTSLIVNFGQEKVGLYVASEGVVRFTSTVSLKGSIDENSSYLSQEIKKLHTYWHTLKDNIDRPEKKLSQVILCGESWSDNITSYLGAYIKTPIVVGNVWTNVFDINDVVPDMAFADSLKYATAVGLALPSETLI